MKRLACLVLLSAGLAMILVVVVAALWQSPQRSEVPPIPPGAVTVTELEPPNPSQPIFVPGTLNELLATLRQLGQGELALVGYVGDDGDIHALTQAALRAPCVEPLVVSCVNCGSGGTALADTDADAFKESAASFDTTTSGFLTTLKFGPSKPYTHEQCLRIQDYATADFVSFCMVLGMSPSCTFDRLKNSARDVGTPAYLEVHDCAWHQGKNPRE